MNKVGNNESVAQLTHAASDLQHSLLRRQPTMIINAVTTMPDPIIEPSFGKRRLYTPALGVHGKRQDADEMRSTRPRNL